MSPTQFLDVPGGRIAYDDTGDGPLIICTPSMLDLRSQLRFLVPLLAEAGFRVVALDQRGMGESSAKWPQYGSTPLAHDLIALIRHLDAGPALIYGTSNGAAAGVYAAAEAPELVRGLILVAPFVRDGQRTLTQRLTLDVFRIPGLARPLYLSYFPKWEPKKPADFAEHKALLAANLKEPARSGVVKAYMTQQSHDEAETRLGRVTAPAIVIMGTGDIDWPAARCLRPGGRPDRRGPARLPDRRSRPHCADPRGPLHSARLVHAAGDQWGGDIDTSFEAPIDFMDRGLRPGAQS